MERDVWSCNTYNYGDGLYWDARYVQDALSFDWYLLYSSFRPFVRSFVPTSSRVLMVGCGNSLMSEDMVKDGYEDIMNVDISSVAIEMMRTKHASVPQLKYMQMDVRDMSYFEDESFDTVIDKGTLDSLMVWTVVYLESSHPPFLTCGKDAPLSASRMLGEVSRLIKPGGTYFLITYGDPKVRMPHLTPSAYNWNISLYILPKLPLLLFLQWYETALFALSPFHFVAERPGFKKPGSRSSSAAKSRLEAIPLTSEGMLPHDYVLEDPDSHFIYICNKKG